MEDIMAMAKDPEARVAIVKMITELRGEIYPMLELMRDTVGVDADRFVDEMIKWSTRKTFVAYVAYQSAGFTKEEAMRLTLNMREDVAAALRSAK